MNSTVTTSSSQDHISFCGGLRSSLCAMRSRATALLERVEPWGQGALLLALRLLYGGFFMQTGWGKLSHLEGTTGFFASLGLPAPAFMATLVGGTELMGGLLLLVGYRARFVAAALTTVMLTALMTAHADKAFESFTAFTAQEPFPFLVATLVVLAFGAGRLSLDGGIAHLRARRDTSEGREDA